MQHARTLEQLKADFLEYIEVEQGKNRKTLENYDRYLSRFIHVTKITYPTDITLDVVSKFIEWLSVHGKNETALKKNTQNYYLIAVRMFLKFLEKKHISSLSYKKVPLYTVVAHTRTELSPHETELLLEVNMGENSKYLRDYAIIMVLAHTGIRVSELCALNVEDVDVKKQTLTVRRYKKTNQIIPLSHETTNAIEAYMSVRKGLHVPLFLNNGKRSSLCNDYRLTPRSVQRIVKQSAFRAGIEAPVTPQTLRNSHTA
jgi:site-specific recombinase XerD